MAPAIETEKEFIFYKETNFILPAARKRKTCSSCCRKCE
jgi:hypothetical protein